MPFDSAHIDPEYKPKTPEEFEACLADFNWRIYSGELYTVTPKNKDGEYGSTIPFKPNEGQRDLLNNLWYRNIVLKGRQIGFTTLTCIIMLDTALFNENQRCGFIAHLGPEAIRIFRDMIKMVYDKLPEELRQRMPTKVCNEEEIIFAHNESSIRVATSLRGGTYDMVHISEFGKISAKFPLRAKEIAAGTLPAIPEQSIVIIESTAEGRGGEFFDYTMKAKKHHDLGKKLSRREYRFHFYAWWDHAEYVTDPTNVLISKEYTDYFAKLERKDGIVTSRAQRAWYVATCENDFNGKVELMWQEFPSTPEEAFQASQEGVYFAKQMQAARLQGRVGVFKYIEGYPVNTFWDIGAGDGCGIWFHQRILHRDIFIKYIEEVGMGYNHFVKIMQDLPFVYGRHYLPHDGDHARQGVMKAVKPIEMLQGLAPSWQFTIVPRVLDKQHAIDAARQTLSASHFDLEDCALGLTSLENYHKKWIQAQQMFSDTPAHEYSEAADAYMQFAQSQDNIFIGAPMRVPNRRHKGLL